MWITGDEAIAEYYKDTMNKGFIDDVDDGIMYNLAQCKIEYNIQSKLLKAIEYKTIH